MVADKLVIATRKLTKSINHLKSSFAFIQKIVFRTFGRKNVECDRSDVQLE